jgi:hypothetical protein
VFAEPREKERYLDTWAGAVGRTGWRVHAWVLMRTPYHLLIGTPEANLVEGMKWFQGTFTPRHVGHHRTCGRLLQGRCMAKLVDDEDPEHFKQVADYIHLNPVAVGLLSRERQEFKQYGWRNCSFAMGSARTRQRVVVRSTRVRQAGRFHAEAPRRWKATRRELEGVLRAGR